MRQTDNLPKVLPLRDWLPEALTQEVQAWNDRLTAVRAAFANEPAEKEAQRLALAADDCNVDAIAAQRQALELAHVGRLIEARKLHRCRPALASACADAGRQVAADAAVAVAAHAQELRRKAAEFNLTGDLVEEVLRLDPEMQRLEGALAGVRYEAGVYGSQAAGDAEAPRTIEAELCRWAGVEPPPADEEEEAEFARRNGRPLTPPSGMMAIVPVGGPPAACPVEDTRSEAQRLVDQGLGYMHLADGRTAADAAEVESQKAAGAPLEPGDEVADPAGEVGGQEVEAAGDDQEGYGPDGYPVDQETGDDPDAAALLPQGDDAGADADADAEEGETADVLQ